MQLAADHLVTPGTCTRSVPTDLDRRGRVRDWFGATGTGMGEIPAEADLQTQLLAMMGRTP